MILKSSRIFLGGIAALLLANCTSSSSSSGSNSSFGGAYEALKDNLPGSSASAMIPVSLRADHSDAAATDWLLVFGETSTGGTLGEYISSLVDEGQEFSVLGRVKNSMMIACFLDLYGPKTAGKMTVGTHTIKMKRSWANSNCPGAAATMDQLFTLAPNVDSQGEIPLLIVVTDISADGVYDRMIVMDGGDNPQFSGSDQTMRLTVDGSNIVFSHDEGDNTNRYTSFLRYNASPELIQFQHTNKNSNVEQAFRFYINETSNAAALLAYDNFNMGASTIVTVLTSKANDLSQGTLSQSYENYNGGAPGQDGTDQQGCINFDTLTITPTNAAFGSCNGITGISASTAYNASNLAVDNYEAQVPADMAHTNTFDKAFDETTITTMAFH